MTDNLEKFRSLGLSEDTLKALHKKGFEEPTPIQEQIIPLLLKENIDAVGQAQTGTGKTAAFGLPLIEKLDPNSKKIQALVLVPTRELALQVSTEINSLKGNKNLSVTPIYGGQSYDQQFRKLKQGVQIVVGTPGRLIDHIHRGTMSLDSIEYLILDEADEMLNMGFVDDVEEIMKHAPNRNRTLLFSATMPKEILDIARKYMKDYKMVTVSSEQITTDLTDQIYFEVSESDKFEALCRIIDMEEEFYSLIFCRTKIDVDDIGRRLMERGYDAEMLHGDLSQFQRERIMDKFRHQKVNILVATDVAARGIDISDLTHVINYALPQDPESYVHRIGRTGRAGKEGTAVTFVTPEEYRKLLYIKKTMKMDIRKEKLPNVSDIINAKKNRLKAEIEELITLENYTDYLPIAQEMVAGNQPVDVIAALLKFAFEDEFDESSYGEIRDVSVSVDRKGKTRLFVALGRVADMNPKKLVGYIQQESGVSGSKIHDVKIYDNFSFITVNFEDAEIILTAFRKMNKGQRPIVEKAKDKR